MVATFLYSLAGGMLVLLATGRMEQIAWRFLRFVGLVVFAIACGLAVWVIYHGNIPASGHGLGVFVLGIASAVSAVAVVFLAPLAARHDRLFRGVCALGGVAGLSAACWSSQIALRTVAHTHPGAALMTIAGQVLGGLLVGSITVAWLLGHAYLTATKMTIAPLRHFSRMLSWAIGLRVAFAAASLGVAWAIGGTDASIVGHLWNAWLIVTMRVAIGLVAVGFFAYMVADCVRLRSTQSATGILYFGSVFAYIGELASQQLLLDCGWPL